MDIVTFRSLSVVFVALAFLGVCWWAFAPSRRKRFNDAANLPFADDLTTNNAHSAKVEKPGKDLDK